MHICHRFFKLYLVFQATIHVGQPWFHGQTSLEKKGLKLWLSNVDLTISQKSSKTFKKDVKFVYIGNSHKAPILMLSLDSSFVHLTFVNEKEVWRCVSGEFSPLSVKKLQSSASLESCCNQKGKALSCCVSGGQKVSRVAKSPIDWNHWLNAATTVYKKALPSFSIYTTAGQLHTSIEEGEADRIGWVLPQFSITWKERLINSSHIGWRLLNRRQKVLAFLFASSQ